MVSTGPLGPADDELDAEMGRLAAAIEAAARSSRPPVVLPEGAEFRLLPDVEGQPRAVVTLSGAVKARAAGMSYAESAGSPAWWRPGMAEGWREPAGLTAEDRRWVAWHMRLAGCRSRPAPGSTAAVTAAVSHALGRQPKPPPDTSWIQMEQIRG